VTGHEGGQGGGASPGDLKLSVVTLGAKEKVGGVKVENQELGAEPLQLATSLYYLGPFSCAPPRYSVMASSWIRHRYVIRVLGFVLAHLLTLACTGISRLRLSPVFRILSLL